MVKKFWNSVFALVATTVGAGIFGLPFVFFKAGFFIGLIEIILLGLIVLLFQEIFGEIVLRTPDRKRWVGLVEVYLGKNWKVAAMVLTIFGSGGIILAYLILGGQFLAILFNLDSFKGSLIFFSFWFLAILVRSRTFGKVEFYLSFLVILTLLFLTLFSLNFINAKNFLEFNWPNVFFPYGLILFAITGFSVIPEMEDILAGDKRRLKKAIFWGTAIPIFIYLVFIFVVLGVSGTLTTPEAILGLARALNSNLILKLGAFLGLMAIGGAALSQGVYFKETLWYDLGLSRHVSWVLAGVLPLTLFFLGFRNFIWVVSFVGAFVWGCQALITLAVHKVAKIKSFEAPAYEIKLGNFVYFLVGFVLILGAALELWFLL